MIIYNCRKNNAICPISKTADFKFEGKNMKKGYKSKAIRKSASYSSKSVDGGRSKKNQKC